MKKGNRPTRITERSIRIIAERIADGKQVRRTLPQRGRLHIDRPLPFLCIYRRSTRRKDEGTHRLVTSEPSYLIAPGGKAYHGQVSALVTGIAEPLVREFGALLLLEIWSDAHRATSNDHDHSPRGPEFTIFADRGAERDDFLDHLRAALTGVRVRRQKAAVSVRRATVKPSANMKPVLSRADAERLGCTVLGLEVAPIYRSPDAAEVYPIVLRELRRNLSRAMRRGFYQFARKRTTHKPRHFHMLGRRAVVKAVWTVDAGLADVGERFDFLLQATPVNAEAAWQEYSRRGFAKKPVFHYRPLAADPIVLKRKLYDVPTERIEDPTLAILFREKLDEMERQLTMLQDFNSKRFLYGSMQLYGEVDERLVGVAEELLRLIPPRARDTSRSGRVDAAVFSACAREEIAYYREQCPEVRAAVEIRPDVPAGLMVSRGSLLIGARFRVPQSRVRALLNHEIGTHVLTYFNGRAQPFRQLYLGLAGYEALQEGLAVLSEYLVGGLSGPRLRLLAARVIAVRRLIHGASFVETCNELSNVFGFARRTAFMITMRVFRGGGLTKDAVYLQGLLDVMAYLQGGGELDPLFVGKISVEHVSVIRELKWRGVLREPPLKPRYLANEAALERLGRVRNGATIFDMVKEARR